MYIDKAGNNGNVGIVGNVGKVGNNGNNIIGNFINTELCRLFKSSLDPGSPTRMPSLERENC